MQLQNMLKHIIEISKQAGEAILKVYNSDDFHVETKDDSSPLTKADLAAHRIIIDGLKQHFADIPRLSEESQGITFEQRKLWQRCFIIDPLDGTKEFIARNDEFTVNIALVENGKVLLGVICVPVFDQVYYAAKGSGAFKQIGDAPAESIKVRSVPKVDGKEQLTVVGSRRHGLDSLQKLCQKLTNYQLISRGSSLKMCMVAEGKADFYPRLAPTSEWDTAAAQIIVEEAGGQLVKTDFSAMTYNQKESILNPHFLVLGDPQFDWKNNLTIS